MKTDRKLMRIHPGASGDEPGRILPVTEVEPEEQLLFNRGGIAGSQTLVPFLQRDGSLFLMTDVIH
ncbi:hypothetical protein AAV35_013690 [Salimicrobium jeotgali]|uniref:Uncharacterized protein n=1 Tax=Salimicrobium jeotgali TaxID=1230341 RepID=K2FK92_9BACI|nr:hypothetical protein AAV35_013690 [Salimicrobium jeotgali]EKE31471.1 hypothetical protein MJ3_08095 [Salimicrobium jeotgali]